MPKSKTPRSSSKKLVARTTASGAQQYIRGKDAYERVNKAGEYVGATKKHKAKQMLLSAQKDAMGSEARVIGSQRNETEKRYSLARGRKRAAIHAQVYGPNAAAKSAFNRIRLK